MSTLRWDRASLTRVGTTPSGGIRLRARIARTGIQEYRMPDGTFRHEFRSPDEVFDEASIASFLGAPLTLGHPEKVNPETWAKEVVGFILVQPDRRQHHDGNEWLEVTVDVTRADAIKMIERGELEELSVGYSADFETKRGSFGGRSYDGIQRNIRANHVALLPKGRARAGREARLLVDEEAGRRAADEADAAWQRGVEQARAARAAEAERQASEDASQAHAERLDGFHVGHEERKRKRDASGDDVAWAGYLKSLHGRDRK